LEPELEKEKNIFRLPNGIFKELWDMFLKNFQNHLDEEEDKNRNFMRYIDYIDVPYN
jgi:hypothetical protein